MRKRGIPVCVRTCDEWMENLMRPVQQKWNADDYAKHSSAQLQWAQELISRLALQGNEAVLDIGCGHGNIAAQLSGAVKKGHVLGIDLSEDMIRLALEKFPPARYPNLAFVCMDATRISLSEKFDVAFSTACLHWVSDQTSVLRGVRTCLKSGSKILFQMGGRGNAQEVFVVIEKLIQQSRWEGYFDNFTAPYHFFGPEEYEAWLLEAGFSPVRVELVPKDMQHQGIEGFKGWLRTTWFPFTDRLPLELRDPFLDEVIETYTKRHPIDALGNTHVNMVRLEAEACAV